MRDLTPATDRQIEAAPFRINWVHIGRILMAFAIAVALWAWVTQRTDPVKERTFSDFALKPVTLNDPLTMVTTLPSVRITLTGPESDILDISRSDLTATLDTSSVKGPGDYRLPIVVSGPSTSGRISVDPKTVQVTVDELISKVMPVESNISRNQITGKNVQDAVPDPSQVTVSGPSSAVNRVSRVVVDVSVDKQTDSFSKLFTPYALDAHGQRVPEVEIRPGQLSVLVNLKTEGKVVNVIPIVNGAPAEGYSVQAKAVEPATVVVDGPPEKLESLLFLNTEPVDVTDATQSMSQTVSLANLPEGVHVISPANGRVEVRVALQNARTTSQTLPGLRVQPINVPAGMNATVAPETIEVTVDGPDTIVSKMSSNDVQVLVDLSDVTEGTTSVTPKVLLPAGVTWISSKPLQVSVTLAPGGSTVPDATPTPRTTPRASLPDAIVRIAPHAQDASRQKRQTPTA